MAISNGYCTLNQFKDFMKITSVDSSDDSFIEKCIESASRWIDSECNTRFYTATETRKYSIKNKQWRTSPGGNTLSFDCYFVSVSKIVNGDNNELDPDFYTLLPLNESPKYAVYLDESHYWNSSITEFVEITGQVGYSANAPTDIYLATLEISKTLYQRRFGENMGTKTVITPAGVVQMPEGVPDWAGATVAGYRRISIG